LVENVVVNGEYHITTYGLHLLLEMMVILLFFCRHYSSL